MKRIALHLRRMTLLIALWMLCQIAHVVASLWMLAASIISPNGKRAWTLAIAYDQLANAAFGGNEDETISSRAGRARLRQRPVTRRWSRRSRPPRSARPRGQHRRG